MEPLPVSDLLINLNDAQHASVTASDGSVLVVAGAGSGKTRVLTTRVAWLLAEKGVRPGEILAFTFTNRAAREMKERVARTVGQDRAPFWIGTFHATGLKILRSDGQSVGVKPGFSIYDTDDQKRLLKQVMADLKIDPKQFTPQGTRAHISKLKNDDISPTRAKAEAGTYIDEKYAELYEAYDAALRKANALDFDDLILRTVQLLESNNEVREKYAQRFRHVLVDEFQDTNPLQMLLVKLLTTVHGNLFVVGDDDQSIYSWRGARIENMLKFEEFFPGAHVFRLEQNYRSTGHILDAANEVIAHNKQRKGKNLWTSGGRGDKLLEEQFRDDEDEAARLVDIVRTETGAGVSKGDITVLYRTNAQSRALEDALRRAHIPYQVVGSLHFYDRKEVRDVMAYLKLISNPADVVSALRVINVPKRKIGKTTVERLQDLAGREELTLGQAAAEPGLLEQQIAPAACKRVREFFQLLTSWRMKINAGMTVRDIVEMVITEVGFNHHLETDDPETAGARSDNVAELLNAAGSFDDASAGDGTLDQFLEQVALVADPDKISDEEGVVRLMTVHTAKGLEFPVVVITGVEDDILPHINSRDDEHSLEEERRLFYVALTRAEKRVYLLHAGRRRRFGTWQDCLPSRFLPEIPDELIDRHLLDDEFDAPVGDSLFGSSSRTSVSHGSSGGGRVGRSSWSQDNSAARRVSPTEWGFSNKKKQKQENQDADWDSDICQDSPYYTGQLVSHGIFGSGRVVRVEGGGDDMMVTVDFFQHGQKHINPRFTSLVPLD